jgi:hypothetical protein
MDDERTMETILRELRERLATQPKNERDRDHQPMQLSEEIERAIRE